MVVIGHFSTKHPTRPKYGQQFMRPLLWIHQLWNLEMACNYLKTCLTRLCAFRSALYIAGILNHPPHQIPWKRANYSEVWCFAVVTCRMNILMIKLLSCRWDETLLCSCHVTVIITSCVIKHSSLTNTCMWFIIINILFCVCINWTCSTHNQPIYYCFHYF